MIIIFADALEKGEVRGSMFMMVYSALLTAVLVLGSPWWLWRMATSGRYRAGLSGRLGIVPAGLKDVVAAAATANRDVVWVHCVSVGEVLGAARLIGELQAALPGIVVAVSTTTQTGQEIAKQKLPGVPVFYMPLDLAWIVRRYLRVLRPKLLVLMESELWPRLLVECERSGIPVAVVNARVSDRSFPRYMRLRRLWKPLMAKVSLFLAQGEETAERLQAIGAPEAKVRVTGNLKYDLQDVAENAMTRRIGSLIWESKLFVAGSTLPGEEAMLLEAWKEIRRECPESALLIAPRHPQRFDEVVDLVRSSRQPFFRCSHLLLDTEPIFPGTVLILDTLGDLASIYSLATVAFLGGSLVPKGGHNPLEAARFGVPVVMGESYENFREMVDGMLAADAIRIVNRPELGATVAALWHDETGVGARGKSFFESQAGATARTVEALLNLLPERAR